MLGGATSRGTLVSQQIKAIIRGCCHLHNLNGGSTYGSTIRVMKASKLSTLLQFPVTDAGMDIVPTRKVK